MLVQVGTIRSGSALIFNVLRYIYGEYNIIRKNNYVINICNTAKYYITYRNPYDCISSFMWCKKMPLTKENIETAVHEYVKNNGEYIINHFQELVIKKNCCVLKYEDFYENFEYLYEELEEFRDIKITDEIRGNVKKFYCIENIKKITDKHKFSKIDSNTKLHGSHISCDNGEINRYKKYLAASHIDIINEEMYKYIGKNKFTQFMLLNEYVD